MKKPLTVGSLIDQIMALAANKGINMNTPIKVEGCDCDGVAKDLTVVNEKVEMYDDDGTYEIEFKHEGPVLYIGRW